MIQINTKFDFEPIITTLIKSNDKKISLNDTLFQLFMGVTIASQSMTIQDKMHHTHTQW